MALARFGGGVSEIRGSIAGNVFSRSRAGAIVRNRAVPVNPSTAAQSEVRARMQSATDGFKNLSKETVTEWNEFAQTQERINRLGEVYVPSGKQLFTEATLNLMNLSGGGDSFADLAAVSVNPNLPAISPYTVAMAQTAAALTDLSINGADDDENTTNFIIQVTPPMLPSYSNVKRYFRQVAIPGAGPAVNISTAYNALFPELVGTYDDLVGLVIHVRVRGLNSSTGLAGAWVYGDVAITLAEE